MVYMFNELSLRKVGSIEETRIVLEKFVRACLLANAFGFTEMRLFENILSNLFQVQLHDGYRIDDWLKDSDVDEIMQIRFREIITSTPLITELEIKQNYLYSSSEFHLDFNNSRQQVWGLGAAYIYETLSISLDTETIWNNHLINLEHYFIEQDGSDKISNVQVRHFFDSQTLHQHKKWWENIQKQSLESSAQLWERKADFFPNLTFSDDVEKQLKNIGVSKMLSQIIDRLRELDLYVHNWTTGNFDFEDANNRTNLRISPESQTTINKFGTLRKFKIEGKGKVLFDLHIKTGDLRFHFYPDNETKKVYVGYIGKHLRIASDG